MGINTSSRAAIAQDLWSASRPNLLFGHPDAAAVIPNDFAAAGYRHVTSLSALLSLSADERQYVLGVLAAGGEDSPTLRERTEFALGVLGVNPAGFFLMVEQADTDKASHTGDLAAVVEAVVGARS